MAHPYRKERVASVVRQIVSEAIAHQMHDPRLEPLTAITRVEMTSDLLIAKVYVSVPGGAAAESRTLAALRHATGYLQRQVAGGMTLRNCPELRFVADQGAQAAQQAAELLKQSQPLPDEDVRHEEQTPPEAESGEEA